MAATTGIKAVATCWLKHWKLASDKFDAKDVLYDLAGALHGQPNGVEESRDTQALGRGFP